MLSFSTLGMLALLATTHGALANPLPAPAPTPPPMRDDGPWASQCTTWMTSLVYGFRGNWQPSVAVTVYTTTSIVYNYVPCNGCALRILTTLAPLYGGIGPQEIVTGITTAVGPSITTSTVCAPEKTASVNTIAPGHMQIPHGEEEKRGDDAGAAGCTSTLTHIPTPWWARPNLNGTTTVFTITTTVQERVDCGECTELSMATATQPSFGHGPQQNTETWTTVTAPTPFTFTSTVCGGKASMTPAAWTPGTPLPTLQTETTTPNATSPVRGDCTSTKALGVKMTFGPVRTMWPKTETETQHVDCGGCNYMASYTLDFLNPGPVVHYTTTATQTTATTTTTYMCLKTPSVVVGGGTSTAGRLFPVQPPPMTKRVEAPTPVKDKDCTITAVIHPTVEGNVKTLWPFTITDTSSVRCHGCALSVRTEHIYYFVSPRYTSTVTPKEPSTAKTFVCAQRTGAPDDWWKSGGGGGGSDDDDDNGEVIDFYQGEQ